jgi:hypothetical protein
MINLHSSTGFGFCIRPSVQTLMEWAQVTRFDPSAKLPPDGSENDKNPCEMGIRTFGRIGQQYLAGKSDCSDLVGPMPDAA